MIPLTVLAAAVLTAVVLASIRKFASHGEPLDAERPEQWLVVHSPARLRRGLRAIDRRVAGGVAVAVAFATMFGCALAVGWILSNMDDGSGIAQWDEAAAEWGARNATDTSTTVLNAITQLGAAIPVLIAMALLGAYHGLHRRDWRPAAYLMIVGVGISLLNNGVKLIVDRERPDIARLSGHSGSSFPSGHSAFAAACAAAIMLIVARKQRTSTRWFASLVAVLVATSVAATRVLLGVHWVSDVVAGVVVGWSWFFVVTVAFGGRLLRFGDPALRIAAGQVEASAADRDAVGGGEELVP